MSLPLLTFSISAALLVSACGDVSAFKRAPTGSYCDWGGPDAPHRPFDPSPAVSDDGSIPFVVCQDERVFNGRGFPESVESTNPCGASEVHGDGDCITYCVPDPRSEGRTYTGRLCVVDPTLPSRQRDVPWDASIAGCEAVIAQAPQDGEVCVGTLWGCAGLVDDRHGAMVWCEAGTLRFVPIPETLSLPHVNLIVLPRFDDGGL